MSVEGDVRRNRNVDGECMSDDGANGETYRRMWVRTRLEQRREMVGSVRLFCGR
jgi:hypothetical protein